MNFILKIVQGPNAGAEIALVEGVAARLGAGESCDIVLADASLPEQACELQTDAENVHIVLPGGKSERLEPFHVRVFGTTAFAVGPAEGAWGDLVWPAKEPEKAETPDAPPAAETPPESGTEAEPRRRRGCLGCLFVLILLLAAICALAWFFRDRVKDLYARGRAWMEERAGGKTREAGTPAPAEEPSPAPGALEALVAKHGLVVRGEGDSRTIVGNFRTRRDRLAATAEAYQAQPGATLDFMDDESLLTAANDLLALVTDGMLSVVSASNRCVAIKGYSPNAAALKKTLEALNADVPRIEKADCSQVLCGGEAPKDLAAAAGRLAPRERVIQPLDDPARRSKTPKMPVVGVITTPYPCLVLKDGSRVMEGSEFSGYVVKKIAADHIEVVGPEGAFTWTP